MHKPARGFSTLEICLCLALALIALHLGAPGLAAMLDHQRTAAALETLERNIALARHAAVTEGGHVTLCGSADGRHCTGDWGAALLAFVDRDGDRRFEEGDRRLRLLEAPRHAVSVTFRAFGSRRALQFTPLGFTRHQNGNFTVCPASGNARAARQLIISRTGRTRRATDRDGDGVREDSQGRPLACP